MTNQCITASPVKRTVALSLRHQRIRNMSNFKIEKYDLGDDLGELEVIISNLFAKDQIIIVSPEAAQFVKNLIELHESLVKTKKLEEEVQKIYENKSL